MTEKNIEYYMSLPYEVDIYPEPDRSGYTAVIPELPGCMTCADTLEELWSMIEEAKRGWLELSLEDGDYIPEPAPIELETAVETPHSAEANRRQLQAHIEEMEVNTAALMLAAKDLLVTIGFDAHHIDTDRYSTEGVRELARLLKICRGGMHYV